VSCTRFVVPKGLISVDCRRLVDSFSPQPFQGPDTWLFLRIPNAIDRWVQQPVLQILESIFEPTFHSSSHGFRPKRGAHTAIAEAKEYVGDGCGVVVDIDLWKFIDRVLHQRLLSRLGQKIAGDPAFRIRSGPACERRLKSAARGGRKVQRWGWVESTLGQLVAPRICVS
jgi:hypothetical protein